MEHSSTRWVRAVTVLTLSVLGALVVLQAAQAKHGADHRIGVAFRQTEAGIEVAAVEPGLPAAAAGLAVGDLLASIDGQAVPDLPTYDAVAGALVPRAPVPTVVRRGGEVVELELRPGCPFPFWRFTGNAIVLVLFAGLGLIVLWRGPADLRARLLCAFSLAVALEFAILPTHVTLGGPLAWAVATLGYFVVNGLQIGLLLHVVSLVPERAAWLERRRWLVPLYYVVGVTIGGGSAVAVVGEFLGVRLLPVSAGLVDRAFFELVMPLWAVSVATVLLAQIRTCRAPKGRLQATLVLLGFAPWVLLVMLSASHALAGGAAPGWLDVLQPIALMVCPVMVFVAIFRYHLFDIELVVRRGLLVGVVATALAVLVYAALGVGGAFGLQRIGEGGSVWLLSGVALILGLLFAPLRGALHRAIDRAYFPERYALREGLVSTAAELPSLGTLPKMGEFLIAKLRSVFAASSGALLVGGGDREALVSVAASPPTLNDGRRIFLSAHDFGVEHLARLRRPSPSTALAGRSAGLDQQLEELGIELVAPVTRDEALVGLLLLGSKRDGTRYSAEEVELLGLLVHHIAAVFENVRLFESATYDGLTGLLRREGVLGLLERERARACRYRRPLSIALVDLDHLKLVNDAYGHLVGDGLLHEVAGVLSSAIRETDALGRYGGDEFLLVLPETELAGARAVAEKIITRLTARPYRMTDGRHVQATVSIGIATLEEIETGREPTSTDLLGLADSRLLTAKRAGRNRIEPTTGSS